MRVSAGKIEEEEDTDPVELKDEKVSPEKVQLNKRVPSNSELQSAEKPPEVNPSTENQALGAKNQANVPSDMPPVNSFLICIASYSNKSSYKARPLC